MVSICWKFYYMNNFVQKEIHKNTSSHKASLLTPFHFLSSSNLLLLVEFTEQFYLSHIETKMLSKATGTRLLVCSDWIPAHHTNKQTEPAN